MCIYADACVLVCAHMYMCTCLLTSACVYCSCVYTLYMNAYVPTLGLLYPIRVQQPIYLSEHDYFLFVTGFTKIVLIGTQTKTCLLPIFNG